MIIDYTNIGRAIEYYRSKGYLYTEVPWMVPVESAMITCPNEEGLYKTHNRYNEEMALVGSAEQGFIYYSHWAKPDTKYVSASPCFRRGDTRHPTHSDTFFKVELMRVPRKRIPIPTWIS